MRVQGGGVGCFAAVCTAVVMDYCWVARPTLDWMADGAVGV